MIYRSYPSLFSAVKVAGRVVDSRLGLTQELLVQTLSVPAGTIVPRPGLNVDLGFAEMLMTIAGTFDPEVLRTVAPRADHSLFTIAAAYGPRLQGALAAAIRELREDPLSRRVVLLLPLPAEDPRTLPCTTSIQFLIRGGTLQTVVSMRSWDLWLGAPYDLMLFGGLALAVARTLGRPAGSVTVTAGSAHIYEKHVEKEAGRNSAMRRFAFLDTAPTTWLDLVEWARTELRRVPWPDGPTHLRVFEPFTMSDGGGLP